MNPRVKAVHDLSVADARENAGLHDYDGVVQDLSPAAVAAGLRALGDGPKEPDPHDEAHLAATEAGLRVAYGDAAQHRTNPMVHIGNLDLACYDREYAPAAEREEARRRHLAGWPDAIDATVEALDSVPGPVARASLPAAQGLAAGLSPGDPATDAALAAHQRLVDHLGRAAAGPDDVALGGAVLARLMGEPEATSVDLGRLATQAQNESVRLRSMLDSACEQLAPGTPTADVVEGLVRDHPGPGGIEVAARQLIDEASAFTAEHDLMPPIDGVCLVGPAPESRRWAMAMMAWAAPYEADAPSWYHVTPPDPSWSPEEQEDWLAAFSHTTLPAITVHEVTPGHFAHGRILRRVRGDVRRSLFSFAFVEGWAHYAEELMLEEGFRAEDPRFRAGVCLEALVRVVRLQVAIGLHTEAITMPEAVRAFEDHAYLKGPAARAEAERATFDPTYGRYTWGKLAILALRDEAQAAWGRRYSHRRFHEALLALGSPPLGLIGNALGEQAP
ncbi:MAG TPA: DUF885 family protein [Acidimicrobiales bacterium]|nr:DUF885 family protein [Acidimicrobiales bacterium]